MTKPNAAEFGEAELRDWFTDGDRLGLAREWDIDDHHSSEESVQRILSDSDLL